MLVELDMFVLILFKGYYIQVVVLLDVEWVKQLLDGFFNFYQVLVEMLFIDDIYWLCLGLLIDCF